MKLQFCIATIAVLLIAGSERFVNPSPIADVTEVPDTCVNLSFACQDLHIARKCKAVTSCIEIWETIKAPEDSSNNEICDLCKQMVQQARDQLLSNETQEEMKEVFEGTCNFIPVKAIATECKKIVDEIVPDIIDMLASRMDPNMVCTVAGLCNNGLLRKLIKEQHKSARPLEIPAVYDDPEKCKSCTQGMMFVRKALHVIPENDFATLLLHSCMEEFHGTHAQCEGFMKELTPIVYNFLKFVGPDTICGQMEMCPKLQETSIKAGDNLTCEFCEALVSYLKTIIDSKTTEAEFKTAFLNMCKELKEFSDQCSNLVNEYFDQFYDFLKKNLQPDKACKAMGLCDDSMVRHIPMLKLSPARRIDSELPIVPVYLTKAQRRQMIKMNRVPLDGEPAVRLVQAEPHEVESASIIRGIKVQPSFDTKHRNRVLDEREEIENERESNSIESSEIQPQQLPVERFSHPSLGTSNDIECSICKAAVIYMEKQLEDNRTEESVKKALDKLCNYFPEELSEQCVDFVNEYADLFIKLLVDRTDPNTICALLKVCPSAIEAELPKELPAELEGSPQCLLCEKIIGYLEKQLENNRTEEAIKEALEKVCSYLPAKYAKECDDFVEKYADMIIDLLTHEVAPMMICAALGLCPAENSVGVTECTVCQYVLHYLQEQLMNPATEEDIKKYVEEVCSKLPRVLTENCDAFIDEYGDSLLVLLAQKIDPSIVCVKFKVCPSGNKAIEPKVTIQSLKLDTCSTCEMVVNYMDKLLENDDVDSEITSLVEKICQIIPLSARDQCVQIIHVYGPYLLQMIGQLSNSRAVCQAVDLCSKAAEKQLLGGEKCTFGPSYWCQSMDHASACNAHTYCREKMWKQ